MGLVVLYPFVYNLWVSFTDMNLYHLRDPSFAGLTHYRAIFAEPELYRVFVKTVLWTVAGRSRAGRSIAPS
jgi:arabinogalactan oligomer/maltooligosaccharide transport system permease protein